MKKSLLSLFAIIMIATNIHAQIPTNGLVAYYPFTGNANDSSGNGNNGTVNGATLTTDRFGRANTGYYFNGNSSITVPLSTSLQPTKKITIAVWVNVDSLNTFPYLTILQTSYQSHSDPFLAYSLGSLYGIKKFQFSISNGTTGSLVNLPSLNNWNSNKWQFIVGTYDGAFLRYYENGVLIDSIAKTGNIGYNANSPLWIGANGISGQTFFGKIDDIRIYNNTLNLNDINNLYHEGGYATSVSSIPSNGLIAWYPFTGNTLDSSGNNNHGTNNGATLTTDRFGKANNAYSFNGSSTLAPYIEATNPLKGTISAVSFSYWYKKNSVTRFEYLMTLGKTSSTFEFLTIPDSIRLTNFNRNNSTNVFLTQHKITGDTNWHNLVVSISSNKTYIILDGAFVDSNSVIPIFPSGGFLDIGKHDLFNISANSSLNGKIDDIRIYNWALSLSDAQALYHEGGYSPTNISSIPKNGLIAWYPFTGNTLDSSGNNNHGTNNGATLTTDRFGKANGAYSFNGSSNYVGINNTLGNFNNSDFTVSSWYFSTAASNGIIFGKRNDCSNGHFFTFGSTGFEIDESALPFNSKKYIAGGYSQKNNSWVNLLFVRTGKRLQVINNTNIVYDTILPYLDSISNADISSIGTRFCSNVPNQLFNGKLDDIRIYNRALNSSEIQALYTEGGYGTTLPLHLTTFTATYQNKQSALRWSSTNETNTANFL